MINLSILESTLRNEFSLWHQDIPPLALGQIQTNVFKQNEFDDDVVNSQTFHFYGGGQHLASVENALVDLSSIEFDACWPKIFAETLQGLMDWEIHFSNDVRTFKDRNRVLAFDPVSLLRAVRAIEKLVRLAPKGSTILEVGPGSGYFALLAHEWGFKVQTLDISFGYNLWQEALYGFWRNLKKSDDNRLRRLKPGDVLRLGGSLPNFDVIVANHAINEFSIHSLAFLFELVNQKYKVSDSPPILLDGWGWGSRTDLKRNYRTNNLLNWFGYQCQYHVDIWSPSAASCKLEARAPLAGTVYQRVNPKDLNNSTLHQHSQDYGELDLSNPLITDNDICKKLLMSSICRRGREFFEPTIAAATLYGSSLLEYENAEVRWFGFHGLNSHPQIPYPMSANDGEFL